MNKKQMKATINGLASEYLKRPTVLTGLENCTRNDLLTILIRLRRVVYLKSQADAIAYGYELKRHNLGDLERYQPDWYLRMKGLDKQARELWRQRYDRKNLQGI